MTNLEIQRIYDEAIDSFFIKYSDKTLTWPDGIQVPVGSEFMNDEDYPEQAKYILIMTCGKILIKKAKDKKINLPKNTDWKYFVINFPIYMATRFGFDFNQNVYLQITNIPIEKIFFSPISSLN